MGLRRLGRGLQARGRARLGILCRDEEQHRHYCAQHSEDASECPAGSDTPRLARMSIDQRSCSHILLRPPKTDQDRA